MFSLKRHWERGRALRLHGAIPGITCADGLYLSVQASEGHYCLPRTTAKEGPCSYTHWEVLAREADPRLAPYHGWTDHDGATCYELVPTDVVEATVEAHGGDATDWARLEAEDKADYAVRGGSVLFRVLDPDGGEMSFDTGYIGEASALTMRVHRLDVRRS